MPSVVTITTYIKKRARENSLFKILALGVSDSQMGFSLLKKKQ